MSNFSQCAESRLDYVIDWTQWLEETDSIASSKWEADSSIVFDGQSFTPNRTVSFISGGLAGQDYLIKNTIVTLAGRVHCQSFTFEITRE